jgi:DNA-binding SARP family transcriptional activator/tetratricopeptide (TPR) repeat protein
MDFRILGPLEVLENRQVLDLGGQKQRALLAVLLLRANEVVSRDNLIEALWEDAPTETARKGLQVYVSQLRKVLGSERLETKPPGYRLRVEPDELDLERFQQLVEAGRPAEALALWRGPALADFAYQRFAQTEIARLEALRVACLEERIEHDLARGAEAELVGELESLVKEQPLRERLRAQLMLALYRAGRQADALDHYQQARTALVEELGIEPGRPLRELHQAILRQDPQLDRAPTTEPLRGGFVGREAELAELLAALDEAIHGRGRLFLLVGEPGVGKSRLAEEVAAQARAQGARVLVGRCWEAGGAPAYWPWTQSLRACVRETDPAVLRDQLGAGAPDLAHLLPELRELFPDMAQPPPLESESARFRLFEAVSSFLTRAARTRPLVLLLDDLHAADEPSLLLLEFVARQLGDSRVLAIGAYRNVDPTPSDPLTTVVTELNREPVTTSLALAGLNKADVAQFIELASGDTAREELVATIHDETGGNPLFVGEIVRLLAADGSLDDPDAMLPAIPQTVRDVIARRLRHLAAECNRVLVLASVLGREFRLDALAQMSAVSEDELFETLDEAMAAKVVSDVPGSLGRLRFAHVLIRDTLYEQLTTAHRVRLHREAAEALESLYGDEPGQHLAELAYHAIAGRNFEKGLRCARLAGDGALELLAYEEAARLYRRALEALELSRLRDEPMRCELLLSLGEAEARAGNSRVAKATFLEAAGVARRRGLSTELARAAAGYGGRIVWVRAGGDDRLVPLLEEGLAALGEEDVELRVRLLGRLAGALRDEPVRDRRDSLSNEAVELARRTGNISALAYALAARGHAIVAPDTVDECFALGTELREVAARSGDRERVVAGHSLRIMAQLISGDIRGAEADLAAAGRVADELNQPAQLWDVTGARALLALATGRLDEADELIAQALALGERALPEAAVPIYWLQRYILCDFRGGLEEVEPAIRDLVTDYPSRPVFRCALVHLQARLGRLADAKRALGELSREGFAVLPFDQEWLYGMSMLAETAALVGDADRAEVLYGLLVPWGAFNAADVSEGFRGSVSRYLGVLAVTSGRSEDGALHFEEALRLNEAMGARPWLAYTQHDYARLLLARDAPSDRARALELLEQALATYRELGMENAAARASELTQHVGTTL